MNLVPKLTAAVAVLGGCCVVQSGGSPFAISERDPSCNNHVTQQLTSPLWRTLIKCFRKVSGNVFQRGCVERNWRQEGFSKGVCFLEQESLSV